MWSEDCNSRYRRPAALSLVLILSVCGTTGAPGAFADANDCDWTVTSETGDKRRLTKDEAEAELVRELAIKLRQFDRCLARDPADTANPAADLQSHGGAGGQPGVASSGGGGQNPGDAAGQAGPGTLGQTGPGAFAQTGDSVAAAGNATGPDIGGDSAGLPPGPATSGAVSTTAAVPAEGPGLPGRADRGRDHVVEDDIARILREAAERETDPARRAALWKEYENYVKNL